MATAFLTGAGSGIGEAVVRRLVARGDNVVLLARNAARADELGARFSGSVPVVADLAEPASLRHQMLGWDLPERLDSLLHIAGIADLGAVAELEPHLWARTLAVNLQSPAELTRLLLPRLRTARGHVVFVNSGSGWHAGARWGAYAASKHGLRALGESLRAEERGNGVRVSSIYPGRVATPMQARIHEQEGRDYDPTEWMDAESVATTVLLALDLPSDAEVTDLSVRPAP